MGSRVCARAGDGQAAFGRAIGREKSACGAGARAGRRGCWHNNEVIVRSPSLLERKGGGVVERSYRSSDPTRLKSALIILNPGVGSFFEKVLHVYSSRPT